MKPRNLSIPSLLAAAILLIGMTTVSFAQNNNNQGQNQNQNKTYHAPEIDLAAGTTALVLLAGGILVIRGRRRQ